MLVRNTQSGHPCWMRNAALGFYIWDQPKACTGNWWKSYNFTIYLGLGFTSMTPCYEYQWNLPKIYHTSGYCNWVIQVSPCWFTCWVHIRWPPKKAKQNKWWPWDRKKGIELFDHLDLTICLGVVSNYFCCWAVFVEDFQFDSYSFRWVAESPVIHMVRWSLLVSQSKCGICKPEPSGFVMDFFWRSFRSRCTKQVNLACDSLTSIEQYKGWSPV